MQPTGAFFSKTPILPKYHHRITVYITGVFYSSSANRDLRNFLWRNWIADELCGELFRGIRVNKFNLKNHLDDILVPITSIDGAVLIDSDGYCYGIGVILDEKAATPANSARGARFNSALVYVENMKREGIKCLCIVISEDGMINPICTQNVDNYISAQINYNELCEENYIYHLNCMYDAYCEGGLDWKEAQHSRLHGDPDCF